MSSYLVDDVINVNCSVKLSDNEDIQKIYEAILDACEQISQHIRYKTSNKVQTQNDFGDTQLDMDIQIDGIIFENLKACGAVYAAASEERPY